MDVQLVKCLGEVKVDDINIYSSFQNPGNFILVLQKLAEAGTSSPKAKPMLVGRVYTNLESQGILEKSGIFIWTGKVREKSGNFKIFSGKFKYCQIT